MPVTKSLFLRVFFCVEFFAMAMVAGSVAVEAAETDTSERGRIMAEIDKRLHNEEARQEAIRAGKQRSVLCANCHGVDGNSVRPDIPNLAEQNTAYIIEQIGKFVDGRRKHFVMAALAKNFTFQDKVNLAVYYTSQELKPGKGDPVLASRGKPLYDKLCLGCHGANGRGVAGYALIAGQKVDYVTATLKRFRDNAIQTGDYEGTQRSDLLMEKATSELSDQEVEALANYIALMD